MPPESIATDSDRHETAATPSNLFIPPPPGAHLEEGCASSLFWELHCPSCPLCGREAGLESDYSAVVPKEVEGSGSKKLPWYKTWYKTCYKTNLEEECGEDISEDQESCRGRETWMDASTLARSTHLSTREERHYAYKPVCDKGKSIRLLLLNPGPPSSPISGRLIPIALGSVDQPAYEALSYTWADESGDQTSSVRIWCHTGYVNATKNGEALLRRVRMRTKYRLVWMDQLCINQSDMLERSQQVGLMPEIYGNASQVLIYLGNSSIIDELLPTLRRGIMDNHNPLHNKMRYLSLVRLRWFSRVWVLQEVARAQYAVILGPTTCLDYPLFRSCFKYLSSLGRIELPGALSIKNHEKTPASEIFDLLMSSNSCCATDPRDKVFALFGIVDSAQEHGLIADYSMDAEEVYTNLALYTIRNYRTLDVLAHCSGEANSLSLPSWVPDWTTTRRTPLIKRLKPWFPGERKFEAFLEHRGADAVFLTGVGNLLVRGRYLTSVLSRWKTDVDGGCLEPCNCGYGRIWMRDVGGRLKKTGAGTFLTENEPALGAREIQSGDQIWQLDGAEQLFALRKHGNAFKVVGECFLFGFFPYENDDDGCKHSSPYHDLKAQDVKLC